MKHIGSTIGIIMGVSLMLTGLTRTESFQSLITGIVVLFGSIAYRSAKKRIPKIDVNMNDLSNSYITNISQKNNMCLIKLDENGDII